jgi:hypothetical protein
MQLQISKSRVNLQTRLLKRRTISCKTDVEIIMSTSGTCTEAFHPGTKGYTQT